MNAVLGERYLCRPESFSQTTLDFAVEDLGYAVVVQVRGEATCDQAIELDEELWLCLRPGIHFVILDLARLTRVGPLALATLAEFSRCLSRKGGEVWLAGLQPAVWLALHTARLERLFTIRPTLAQALAS